MFDKKRIRLNHIKSFNKNSKRVINFFETISEILIEKIFDNNQDYRSKNILEVASRNDILRNKIYCKSFQSNYFQNVIRVLRWIVELGRIDIAYEVSSFSKFLARSRTGQIY